MYEELQITKDPVLQEKIRMKYQKNFMGGFR
jgi:hypothetical protein